MSTAPFSDALRAAVEADGRTSYAIAQAAGLRIQVLTRWLSGERDLRLASADKLGAALGVTCVRCSQAAVEDDPTAPQDKQAGTGSRAATAKKPTRRKPGGAK